MPINFSLLARTGLAFAVASAISGPVAAKVIDIHIDNARGVDATVPYTKLTAFGPWDDRNYQLTAADLALLSPNETESHDPTPAFFRVWMRKEAINEGHPLPTSGAAQYPRKAVNLFLAKFKGIQINGHFYQAISRVEGNRFEVYDEEEVEEMNESWPRFHTGEVKITPPAYEETAIAVNPTNTDIVIAGSNGIGANQIMWRSTDGGATWSNPINLPANSFCDPSVGWSADGLTGYTTSLLLSGGSGGALYRSTDAGVTWSQGPTFGTSGSDKEYLHVDTFPASPYKDNIYISWHEGNIQKFTRSTDKGATFGPTLTIDSTYRGIGSDITSDKDGNVYYFFPTSSGARQVRVVKSTDGGASFASTGVKVADTKAQFDFPLPSMPSRRAFIYVSADADRSNGPYANSIYVAWPDTYDTESESSPTANHARVQVAYSRDGGATWNTSTPHPTTDGQTVDRYQEWLKVDEWGRVHVVYYDTRNSTNRTGVDMYYSVSVDGAQTWSEPRRLTTQTSPKINTSMEWGDYNGMDMVMNDIIAIYTDNRIAGQGEVWGIAGFADPASADYRLTVPSDTQYVCAGGSIDPLAVAVGSQSGYTGSVTLSLPGLDTSVFSGGVFTPNPITVPADDSTTSMLTLGTVASATDGVYPVLVRGTDNQSPASVKEATFNVQVASGQPDVPALAAPLDGATDVANQTVFTWAADASAVNYTIEIATDAAFTSIVETGTPTDATYTVQQPLQDLTTYYWRVRSNSPCGDSASSPTRSFTTGMPFPNPYCPVSFPSNVEPITRVMLSGIDNHSSATVGGSPAHEDFLSVTGGAVMPGQSYAITVEGNTDGNYTTKVKAFIDWNHNGTFDVGEDVVIGDLINSTGTDGKQVTANITVPADAASGQTRLRVIKKYNTAPTACNADGYGQAEDYTLTVGNPHTVGGEVSGLSGTGLNLTLNASIRLPISADGPFTFPGTLSVGQAYDVRVGMQPSNPAQTCVVTNGSGTMADADVTDVQVTCTDDIDDEIFADGFESPTP